MNYLSGQDKALIVKFYYQSDECLASALRKYCHVKGIKDVKHDSPNYNSIKNMIERFEETGNCNKCSPPGRPSGDAKANIEEYIAEEGFHTSCRKSSANASVSKSHYHRYLRYHLKLFPYKPSIEHYLSPNSVNERKIFCSKFLTNVDEDDSWIENILFSDESNFELDGGNINKQNVRFWGRGRPIASTITAKQFPKKLMVWCGFTANLFIGPYFFEESVNAESYQKMIAEFVIPELKSHRKYNTTIFMQDGATPHTCSSTKAFLQQRFNERVISRGHDFAWPSYSPDLNPLDFALWGHIKQQLFSHQLSTVDELKEAIKEEMQALPASFFKNSVYSIINRCVLCLEADGGNFM